MYNIKLTQEQINVILYSLSKQPYEYVAATILELQKQLQELSNKKNIES